jgi:hypothetical protein
MEQEAFNPERNENALLYYAFSLWRWNGISHIFVITSRKSKKTQTLPELDFFNFRSGFFFAGVEVIKQGDAAVSNGSNRNRA